MFRREEFLNGFEDNAYWGLSSNGTENLHKDAG